MTSTLERKEDGTLTLHATIPWETVKKTWNIVLEGAAKQANMPGFRKGKAPQKLVEENTDKAKVREEVLKNVLPQAYVKAVEEHNLKPILNPQVHVEKVDENEDWTFTATTCEMPQITLKDYKKKVKDVTAKSKIVIPGKEEQGPNLDEIIKVLIDCVEVTIPQILIDQEVDRLLSQMLDEVKRLGLTLDQYMASTKKSPEQLREEYAQKAVSDMKTEFALQQVAEEEKITVDEKEIGEAVQKAQNPSERANLEANRYLLANILRQQKTLDFLRNL
jgi:FKBP-type peptidyl-prolyl cis-trans isomerase (trigger factor)